MGLNYLARELAEALLKPRIAWCLGCVSCLPRSMKSLSENSPESWQNFIPVMADFMSTWLVHEVTRYMAKFFGVFMKMFPAFELIDSVKQIALPV